jgi:hypothetical protein
VEAVIKLISVFGMLGLLALTGCASSSYKARQEQREKLANSAGLYCEWINGDKHSDIDVELNLQMAKRCDSSRPFTLTPYKNTADQNGIMYCCAMAGAEQKVARKASAPAAQSSAKEAAAAAISAPAAKSAGPQSDDIEEDK